MAKQDRHLTTTELSAFLDGQLSLQEQVRCDAHLKTCEQCRQTLAALRQTVTLLHALPQPPLPRSFLLSSDEAFAPSAARQVPNVSVIELPIRRIVRPGYIQNTLRSLSALAAIVGLFFLLSGIFSAIPYHVAGETSTASPAVPAATNHSVESPTAKTSPGAVTPNMTPAARITTPSPNAKPVFESQAPTPLRSLLVAFNFSTQQGRALTGLVLLVIGTVSFFFLTRLRRRQRRN